MESQTSISILALKIRCGSNPHLTAETEESGSRKQLALLNLSFLTLHTDTWGQLFAGGALSCAQ